jgi:hypothetical protein
MMKETLRKYTKPTYTKNDLREDPRLEGKMGWRRAAREALILFGQ